MRYRGWLELGFRESFIVDAFVRGGFVWIKHPCDASPFAVVHEFRRRPNTIVLSTYTMSPADDGTWHEKEATGRWTRERSAITLDATDSFTSLVVTGINSHSRSMLVRFSYGADVFEFVFAAGERKDCSIPRRDPARALVLTCDAQQPSGVGASDTRRLGIHIESIRYIRGHDQI